VRDRAAQRRVPGPCAERCGPALDRTGDISLMIAQMKKLIVIALAALGGYLVYRMLNSEYRAPRAS